MKEALPASATGKPIEIWFQDEARVGQKGTLEYIWAPVGSRPRAVRETATTRFICLAHSVRIAQLVPPSLCLPPTAKP